MLQQGRQRASPESALDHISFSGFSEFFVFGGLFLHFIVSYGVYVVYRMAYGVWVYTVDKTPYVVTLIIIIIFLRPPILIKYNVNAAAEGVFVVFFSFLFYLHVVPRMKAFTWT